MNKIAKKASALALCMVLLSGCTPATEDSGLPTRGPVTDSGLDINPQSVVGYVGDVMPFYEDGVMNIFYLQDGRNTHLGFHPFALMTTTDLVNYKDYGVVIPYVDNIYDQDLALGTGCVIKDKNGLYHAFYTGHNSNKNSGLDYFEKIQHATSTDKLNWTKIPEDGFYGGHNDFRDPYVYYSDADACYYMLITTRDGGSGVIKRYKSTDLSKWDYVDIFFRNDSGTYNMECPTFLEYNGYYYLSYSEQGNHRVTHYRYKKNLDDPWIKPEVDYFDGEGFYAARMEKGFDKLLIFGWCGTKQGDFDFGNWDWGGNLVSHQLVQQPNGELRVQMIDEIKAELSDEVVYNRVNKEALTDMDFSFEQKAVCLDKLTMNVTRMHFKLTAKQLLGDVGMSFATSRDDDLSNLLISFDLKNNALRFYNNAVGFEDYGDAQISVPFQFEENKAYDVDVIIDDSIITVYLDNTICLTTRMYEMEEANLSFYGNKTNAVITDVKFYE